MSGTSPLHKIITVPVLSRPLLPARPAICMYSPGSNSRNFVPSCFRIESKTTVLAGMFTPIAKVSVAKRSCKTKQKIQKSHMFKCLLIIIID